MVVPAKAVGLSADNGHYSIELADGTVVNGRTLIVATGAQYRKQGEPALEAVVVIDKRTGERRELKAKALFVFIGADPHTDWLRGQIKRVASAVGEGSMAVRLVHQRLSSP